MAADKVIEAFWKPALAVGGVSAIGAFVFYSLYEDWLSLDIFSQLSPDHTFLIMLVFLVLVFLMAIGMLIAWFLDKARGSKSNTVDSVEFSVPENWTFQQAAQALASEHGSVTDMIGFSSQELQIQLKPQTLRASSTVRAIELLKNLGQKDIPSYQVVHIDGKYSVTKA